MVSHLQRVLEFGGGQLGEPREGRDASVVVHLEVGAAQVQQVAVRDVAPAVACEKRRVVEDVAAARDVARARGAAAARLGLLAGVPASVRK